MHCNCKVASPTCFCKPTSFHKLCTGRNTDTWLICGPIVFSKPVLSAGSRPSPLYCVRYPLFMNCAFVLALGISKFQIEYFWPLGKVRKSGRLKTSLVHIFLTNLKERFSAERQNAWDQKPAMFCFWHLHVYSWYIVISLLRVRCLNSASTSLPLTKFVRSVKLSLL